MKSNRFIKNIPTKLQEEFLNDDCFLKTWKGKGLGGTTALLIAATQYVDEPYYVALIVEPTYPQALILVEKAKSWWSDETDVHFSNLKHTWTFPSGAKIRIENLKELPEDIYYYTAMDLPFIGIDCYHSYTDHLSSLEKLKLRCRLPYGISKSVPRRIRIVS